MSGRDTYLLDDMEMFRECFGMCLVWCVWGDQISWAFLGDRKILGSQRSGTAGGLRGGRHRETPIVELVMVSDFFRLGKQAKKSGRKAPTRKYRETLFVLQSCAFA